METVPFDLIVGKRYSNKIASRLIESISLKDNEVRYIEDLNGHKKSSYCTIEQFYGWMDD